MSGSNTVSRSAPVSAPDADPLDRAAPPRRRTRPHPRQWSPSASPKRSGCIKPQWARVRRAAITPGGDCGRLLVVVTDGPADNLLTPQLVTTLAKPHRHSHPGRIFASCLRGPAQF